MAIFLGAIFPGLIFPHENWPTMKFFCEIFFTTVNYWHKEIYYRYCRGPRYASETSYYNKFENEELFSGGTFPGGHISGGQFSRGLDSRWHFSVHRKKWLLSCSYNSHWSLISEHLSIIGKDLNLLCANYDKTFLMGALYYGKIFLMMQSLMTTFLWIFVMCIISKIW